MELYRSNTILARLQLDLSDETPYIEADGVRIRQLLHNLIKNALEALDGVEQAVVKIQTRCGQEAANTRFVDVTISDNGPGFPAQLMDHIFEPYVTNKPKGNGLGLAIVKKIVEEHGGMVQAENAPQGGARVLIRLFLAQER